MYYIDAHEHEIMCVVDDQSINGWGHTSTAHDGLQGILSAIPEYRPHPGPDIKVLPPKPRDVIDPNDARQSVDGVYRSLPLPDV